MIKVNIIKKYNPLTWEDDFHEGYRNFYAETYFLMTDKIMNITQNPTNNQNDIWQVNEKLTGSEILNIVKQNTNLGGIWIDFNFHYTHILIQLINKHLPECMIIVGIVDNECLAKQLLYHGVSVIIDNLKLPTNLCKVDTIEELRKNLGCTFFDIQRHSSNINFDEHVNLPANYEGPFIEKSEFINYCYKKYLNREVDTIGFNSLIKFPVHFLYIQLPKILKESQEFKEHFQKFNLAS